MPHDLRTPQQRDAGAGQRPHRPRGRDRRPAASSSATAASPRSTPARPCRRAPRTAAATTSPPASSSSTPTTSSATSSRAPGVRWPEAPAILAHDAELAGTGITTVFDALRVGSLVAGGKSGYGRYARPLASEINRLRDAGALRIRHLLHLRAETCSETLVDELAEFGPADGVGILSLMDHTPGQRQFTDIGKLRDYATGRRDMNEAEFQAHVAMLKGLRARNGARHEAAAVAGARRLGATLASHDDATPRRWPSPPATARASPSSRPPPRPPPPAARTASR